MRTVLVMCAAICGAVVVRFIRGVYRDLDEYADDPQVYNFTGYGGRLREQERTYVGAVDETGRVPPVGTFRLVPGGFKVPITRRRP
jgi:hypothetical protein